jgi:hypothetical protein
LACSTPISVEALAGPGPGHPVNRIAVAPLLVAPQVERAGARAGAVEPGAAEMVGSRVVEALAEQGEIAYVAPAEVALWLERSGLSMRGDDPQRLGGELARAFGVDAILFGRVRRYLSRVGGTHGATRPASVWFDLELRLPDGTRVWAGSYREEQKSLAEDLLSLPRAAQRGFTWLDAPSLAAYGARELIAKLAQERRRWK